MLTDAETAAAPPPLSCSSYYPLQTHVLSTVGTISDYRILHSHNLGFPSLAYYCHDADDDAGCIVHVWYGGHC